jgi:hypothetical protein
MRTWSLFSDGSTLTLFRSAAEQSSTTRWEGKERVRHARQGLPHEVANRLPLRRIVPHWLVRYHFGGDAIGCLPDPLSFIQLVYRSPGFVFVVVGDVSPKVLSHNAHEKSAGVGCKPVSPFGGGEELETACDAVFQESSGHCLAKQLVGSRWLSQIYSKHMAECWRLCFSGLLSLNTRILSSLLVFNSRREIPV